jgi:DNA-binding transcriptional LysR family regulator
MAGAVMTWDRHIGRRLKLRDLYILIAVEREKSMGGAARKLNMSQPAVSNAIADLERIIGYRLLDRSRRGVEPSAYGSALIKHGLAVFEELKESIKEIEFLADPTAGEIFIGAAPPIAVGFVPAVIQRLARDCPRLVFHVVEAEPAAVHQHLRERSIEVGIARTLGPQPDMSADVLFDNSHVVVAATKSRWARRRRKIKLAELIQEPWVMPPEGSPSYSMIEMLFRQDGLAMPRARVSTFSLGVRKSMAAGGRFLAMIPRGALQFPPHDPSVTSLRVDLPAARYQAAILTMRDRTISPMAKLFIDCAREVAKPLANKK